MRVLMLVFNNYVTDPRVRREAEALFDRGDSVDCICLHDAKGNGSTPPAAEGIRLFFPSGIKYHGSRLLPHVLSNLRFFWFAFVTASLLHLKDSYDVVQVHTMPDFLVFAALIPKLLGAKVILDVHDLMPEVYMTKFGLGYDSRVVRLIRWVERRSVAFADRAICVHTPHLDVLVRHGNPREKFEVLLNLPDEKIFVRRAARASSHRDFRLIYYGSIPKRAGLDVALKAMACARREIPDLRFTIIGDEGEGIEPMFSVIRELELTDCIDFIPGMDLRELPAVIMEAAVSLIPYRADAFTRYVLPTKLMECAALGVPVIASRLFTIEFYFDDEMVAYVRPGDHIDLAREIVRLYRNPEVAASLALNAARFTESHSWQGQKAVYYRLVDSLIPNHAPAPTLATDAQPERTAESRNLMKG